MYMTDEYCPKCNTRLKQTRMTMGYFCEKCWEFKTLPKTDIGKLWDKRINGEK